MPANVAWVGARKATTPSARSTHRMAAHAVNPQTLTTANETRWCSDDARAHLSSPLPRVSSAARGSPLGRRAQACEGRDAGMFTIAARERHPECLFFKQESVRGEPILFPLLRGRVVVVEAVGASVRTDSQCGGFVSSNFYPVRPGPVYPARDVFGGRSASTTGGASKSLYERSAGLPHRRPRALSKYHGVYSTPGPRIYHTYHGVRCGVSLCRA